MFDFSMGELGVTFAVALIVIGPKKLPEVAKMLGKGLGSLKKALDEVKEGVQTELNEIKDTSGIKEVIARHDRTGKDRLQECRGRVSCGNVSK
jgi:TatA/E family protein of Tat protein translocase